MSRARMMYESQDTYMHSLLPNIGFRASIISAFTLLRGNVCCAIGLIYTVSRPEE